MRTAFVNRGGIVQPPGVEADVEVPSVAALADLLAGG